MDAADQLEPPVAELLEVARAVIPRWLRRLVVDAAAAARFDAAPHSAMIDAMVSAESDRLSASLHRLLAADVDHQRSNPLALFRSATAAPTAVLREIGVPERPRDRFAIEAFPDDVYGLVPASWADIDPALQEPGIAWGAWKAMTVLSRRRSEPA